jgi:predicted acylesterase/phospholipase RssA
MGSIVAAQYAMGWDFDTILEVNRNTWIRARPLNDYTLPVHSVISGRRINRLSRQAFGDRRIEDLPMGFFCVSSNLTRAGERVHREGLLWKAVRASSSLPGILQPWIQDSELLVDGGIVNNLPGDVMRSLCRGSLILCDVGTSEALSLESGRVPSPWRTALGKVFPLSPGEKAPTLFDVLIRSTLLASARKTEEVKQDADLCFRPPVEAYGLLEFRSMDRIVRVGYDHACSTLEKLRQDGILDSLVSRSPGPGTGRG